MRWCCDADVGRSGRTGGASRGAAGRAGRARRGVIRTAPRADRCHVVVARTPGGYPDLWSWSQDGPRTGSDTVTPRLGFLLTLGALAAGGAPAPAQTPPIPPSSTATSRATAGRSDRPDEGPPAPGAEK